MNVSPTSDQQWNNLNRDISEYTDAELGAMMRKEQNNSSALNLNTSRDLSENKYKETNAGNLAALKNNDDDVEDEEDDLRFVRIDSQYFSFNQFGAIEKLGT